MPSPQDSNSPVTSAPLDNRLHLMVTQAMKLDIELAAGAPGFKSEADVVRYCLEQALPGLLVQARERYTGRTRLLVDTVDDGPAPTRRDGHRPPPMVRPGVSERRWGPTDAAVGAAVDAGIPLTRDQELGYVVSGDPFAPISDVQ